MYHYYICDLKLYYYSFWSKLLYMNFKRFPRTVSPRSNTTSNPISTIICNLKSDTIHISRQKERVCTEEERRIWEKYTTKQLEEETLRDVDLVKHRTDKSWEESLQAIVEHNWDIAHATQFLLTY